MFCFSLLTPCLILSNPHEKTTTTDGKSRIFPGDSQKVECFLKKIGWMHSKDNLIVKIKIGAVSVYHQTITTPGFN
jgi:hypothetical protein